MALEGKDSFAFFCALDLLKGDDILSRAASRARLLVSVLDCIFDALFCYALIPKVAHDWLVVPSRHFFDRLPSQALLIEKSRKV